MNNRHDVPGYAVPTAAAPEPWYRKLQTRVRIFLRAWRHERAGRYDV